MKDDKLMDFHLLVSKDYDPVKGGKGIIIGAIKKALVSHKKFPKVIGVFPTEKDTIKSAKRNKVEVK